MGIQLNKSEKKGSSYNWKQIVFGILGIFLMLYVLYLVPNIKGITDAARISMAVFAFMISWWIGEVVSPVVVALVGCVLLTALGVAKIDITFSGFSNSTEIFLIFAFLMAVAVTKTGLGKRIASAIISKTNPSYKMVLFLLMFSGLILGAIIPSGNARIVLLGTIAVSLLSVFNQSPDKQSNIGKGLFILLGISSMLTCDPYMTGGASSILLVGLLDKAGITISYFDWFLNLFPPVMISLIALWWITYKMFPPEVEKLDQESYLKLKNQMKNEVGKISLPELKVAVITVGVIIFWIFGNMLHLKADIVCLVGVALMFLPGIGVLGPKDIKSIPWDTLVFIGCALSLGTVIAETKLDVFLANIVAPLLVSKSVYVLGFKLLFAAMTVHFIIADALPIFAIFIPIVIATMNSLGINPLVGVIFFQLGTTAYIMLYQQAQAITVYGFGQFEQRDFMKVGAFTYLIWFLMVPLLIFWFKVRGLL